MALVSLTNEIELLEAVSLGDEKSFAQIFHAYHNQLGTFIFSITRSREMTEEIVQDIFVKIWNDREKLKKVQKFNSYIFVLTKNYTLNAIRQSNALEKKATEFQRFSLQVVEPEVQEQVELNYQLVEHAVSMLPAQQQKVYMMKRDGLKNADIAVRMNLSLNSVKKYQQWAIQAIGKFVRHKNAFHILFMVLLVYFKK